MKNNKIKYWLPSASITIYGKTMPKYKWLMSTWRIYFAAWQAYIPIYLEVTRGLGFLFCLKHNKAILNVVGRTFTEFMKSPYKEKKTRAC